MIFEIDIPSNGKNVNYGLGCLENNIYELNIEKLEVLLNYTS